MYLEEVNKLTFLSYKIELPWVKSWKIRFAIDKKLFYVKIEIPMRFLSGSSQYQQW